MARLESVGRAPGGMGRRAAGERARGGVGNGDGNGGWMERVIGLVVDVLRRESEAGAWTSFGDGGVTVFLDWQEVVMACWRVCIAETGGICRAPEKERAGRSEIFMLTHENNLRTINLGKEVKHFSL